MKEIKSPWFTSEELRLHDKLDEAVTKKSTYSMHRRHLKCLLFSNKRYFNYIAPTH